MKLSRKERITGCIAKRIVLIASWINATAVLSVCVEATRIYNESMRNEQIPDQ